jgi:hypothetical protein
MHKTTAKPMVCGSTVPTSELDQTAIIIHAVIRDMQDHILITNLVPLPLKLPEEPSAAEYDKNIRPAQPTYIVAGF